MAHHHGVIYQPGPDSTAIEYLPLEELRVTILIIDGEHSLTLSFVLVLIHPKLPLVSR